MRYRFCDFKGPRILIGWVISLKTNRATSGYISLIRVRSSVAHPTASRREIRDRRASLIAPFPSQASPPFSYLTSVSLSLSREFSRLSTAVVNYCRGRFRREFHRNTLPDLRSYEAYRGLSRLRECVFRKIEMLPAGFYETVKLRMHGFFTFYPRNIFLLGKYLCTVLIVYFFISCDKQLTFSKINVYFFLTGGKNFIPSVKQFRIIFNISS